MIMVGRPVTHLAISQYFSAAQWIKKVRAKMVINIVHNHRFKMANTAYLNIGKIVSISRDILLIKRSWSMIHVKISIKFKSRIKGKKNTAILFKRE
jgi:hypothetical protein